VVKIRRKKKVPTKDTSKREGLHDCLEIWPVWKHAILNININILSRELQMEQKKRVDENQEKKNDELSVSPVFLVFVFLLLFINHFAWFRV